MVEHAISHGSLEKKGDGNRDGRGMGVLKLMCSNWKVAWAKGRQTEN
jgi:hypothetical protein